MRRLTIVSCAFPCAALAALAACAEADVVLGSPILAPDGGDSVNVLPDSGDVVEASASDAPPHPTCSPAGWCETSLPDEDLTFRSIWPLEGRAFATAESPTVGVKVLEWEDASAKWQYIDDNSQNQSGLARYVANIWAANENEIYYAVARGAIVRGTRPAPGSPWTWTPSTLEDYSPVHTRHTYSHDYPTETISGSPYPTLGVWGTKDGDIYAWYTNTIYHLTTSDSGGLSWVAEYTAEDAVSDDANGLYEELFALGATGVSRDDLWFTFVRTNMGYYSGSCPVLVRKTSAGYERVIDGVLGTYRCQGPRDGIPMLGTERGWLTDLHVIGEDQVAGLLGGRRFVRITKRPEGYVTSTASILALDPVDDFQAGISPFLASVHPTSDRFWMSGTGLPGTGIALSSGNLWDADAGYQVSTLSTTGAPLPGAMYQVRGTSNTNLWLVGARHALHKTTL